MGTFDIYWDVGQKRIRYICNGQMTFDRPNEQIKQSLLSLFGGLPENMEIQNLIIYEDKHPTYVKNHEKMAIDFFNCEWSDYAMDRMYFRVNLAIGSPEIRLQQFNSMLIQEQQNQQMALDEDPQPVYG